MPTASANCRARSDEEAATATTSTLPRRRTASVCTRPIKPVPNMAVWILDFLMRDVMKANGSEFSQPPLGPTAFRGRNGTHVKYSAGAVEPSIVLRKLALGHVADHFQCTVDFRSAVVDMGAVALPPRTE